jgi:chromosome segregation protein
MWYESFTIYGISARNVNAIFFWCDESPAREVSMRIKKISITGFKSFMGRLDIPFPWGISAIVGPNGCGKSNIVDAVRWALGEQSAKQLRGRNMEDVICNGADNHKPLGMAEVSILFENGNHSFPQEFSHLSELSVTRRLYRSGESEYLINSVPCRLKDIQEIFMDTGLGNRAYSVIGQGKISAIVEQKPEETRVMLEEAAGITKYRKKVDETQRKIDLTKGNLQRVEDILGEVEKQMRSLKYQASKARRFKSISQEIQDLELVLNANSYHALKEDSGHQMKSTEALMQEEVALSTRYSAIQAKVETMHLERGEKEKEVSHLREAYLISKEVMNKETATLNTLAGEKKMQKELEARLVKDKEDGAQRLTALQDENGRLKEKVTKLRERVKGLESEMWLIDERLRQRKGLLDECKEEYERTKDKVNSGVTKEMSLSQESGYLNKRIGEITDSRTRLEKERHEVGLNIKKIVEASDRNNVNREALTRKLEALKEDILRGEQRSEELTETKKVLESELKLIEADLNIYQSRLSSLRSMTENFEGYKVGVRTIMKANDLQPRREGRIKGLVADVIQVDAKYEQAVEAVLADRLQYIIVESQVDGKEAVDYLKLKAKGRGSFVPIADLNRENGQNNDGDFPLLADLVSVSDVYKPLISALFGNAVLVEDLEQAIAAWRSNGKDICLVTPEGDIVDSKGIISGGKLTHSSRGILGRKREIKELEENVSQSEKEIKKLHGKLTTINQEIEKQNTSLETLLDEKSEQQEKLNDLDKAIFQLGQELDQQKKLSDRITEELEKNRKDQWSHEKALSDIASELKLFEDKRKEQERYLLQKENELKECEEEFEEIRNEGQKLKMDHSLCQEEEKGLLREIDRIDEFTYETEKKLERINEDILTAQRKYQECLDREEVSRNRLVGLGEKAARAEEAVNVAEKDRNQFQLKIREEEKAGESLRGDLEILREKLNNAKLEHSEIGFKMNGFVEVVKERFNLNLHEIYKEYLKDDFDELESRESLERKKKQKAGLGEVNLTAIQEYEVLKERHDFMVSQREDLIQSIGSLDKAIKKINKTSLERFMETFQEVDKKLKHVFPILFDGGNAGLKFLDETRPLETGVLVEVRPPGKKLSHMGLLSGGEKALVAMALLFSLYLIKPSPFCLLDEVDAPLDEANINRFNELLIEIKKYSQIILVTHNRRSMEIVDSLFGVTMEKAGISKMVSVNLQKFRQN